MLFRSEAESATGKFRGPQDDNALGDGYWALDMCLALCSVTAGLSEESRGLVVVSSSDGAGSSANGDPGSLGLGRCCPAPVVCAHLA